MKRIIMVILTNRWVKWTGRRVVNHYFQYVIFPDLNDKSISFKGLEKICFTLFNTAPSKLYLTTRFPLCRWSTGSLPNDIESKIFFRTFEIVEERCIWKQTKSRTTIRSSTEFWVKPVHHMLPCLLRSLLEFLWVVRASRLPCLPARGDGQSSGPGMVHHFIHNPLFNLINFYSICSRPVVTLLLNQCISSGHYSS